MRSSTTTPRWTSSRAEAASAVLGRMPTAITTSAAGRIVPSFSSTEVTPSSLPWIALVCASVMIVSPRRSRSARSRAPAAGSSWRSISVAIRCRTVTFIPSAARPFAASSPSRPPPITTASPPTRGGRHHRVHVRHVAEADHAGQVAPHHRQDERVRPGGEQQHVVGARGPVLALHDLLGAVDVPHPLAGDQLDAVLGVPLAGVDDDLVELLLARQQRAEHDAVVVRVRLRPEHGDVESAGIAGEDLLHRPHAGHSVADDDQALPHVHVHHPQIRAAEAEPQVLRQRCFTPVSPASATQASRANSTNPVE